MASYTKSRILREFVERENHQISRKLLMSKWATNIDEFNQIMQGFIDAGMVTAHVAGDAMLYKMPKEVVERYQRLLARTAQRRE